MTPERKATLDEALAIVAQQSGAPVRRYHLCALKEALDELTAALDELSKERNMLPSTNLMEAIMPDETKTEETTGQVEANDIVSKDAEPALSAVVTLITDGINDYENFAAGDKSVLSAFGAFSNLTGDIISIIESAPDLPKELAALGEAEVQSLVSQIASKLKLETPAAQQVLDSGVQVVNDLVGAYYDVVALYKSIQAAKAPPSA